MKQESPCFSCGECQAKDECQSHYNVEMQVKRKAALGKRSRYYQSQMDMELLLSGEDYSELPDTYVIFICDFDPFEEGKYRYTFKMTCKESVQTNLEDGRTIVFLNTHGKNESEVPKELVTFLKYVKADLAGSEEAFDDSYVEQLQNFIRKIKGSREMEERFMIFEEMLKEEREEGREEGRSVLKETLLLCLQSFGDVPDEVLEQIQAQQNMEVLKNWMQTAFQSKTLEEFVQKM
ncbi:Rpn family recombination-promoting nuclease/putative transposase [Faecalimonas umbilicata]|uniref:Rpn family recombination-promoting nuclease/putative transposase n=1 Tax=Faecalimonas umbilicata TaxID=1912855 RepID=UPI003994B6B1